MSTTLNHKIFNTRNYFIGGVIVVLIFLAFVFFRKCHNSPSHNEEVKEVKALQEQLKEREFKSVADSIRWVKQQDSLKTVLVNLETKRVLIDIELKQTKKAVRSLIAANDHAIEERDTLLYIATCDSLKDLATLQGEIITMYQFNDSARTANYEDQLMAKDSLLTNRAALIAQLRHANTETYSALMQINTDYNKISRKLKRERTLSRVLAAGVAVLGGAILLK